MQNKRKIVLISIAFVLIIAIAVLSYDYIGGKYSETKSQQETSKEANMAPDFTVLNSDGTEVAFSDFVGKPIIINFWASWCGPCVSEMPVFDKIYKELGDEVVFLMVNLTDGSRETITSAKNFVQKGGYSFPIYFDTKYSAATVYGVSSIPATVFIDADGVIKESYLGAMTEATFRSKLMSIYND